MPDYPQVAFLAQFLMSEVPLYRRPSMSTREPSVNASETDFLFLSDSDAPYDAQVSLLFFFIALKPRVE